MFTPSFPPADADARAALIDWIRQTPLVYGPWQSFKRLYKEAEAAYIDGAPSPEIMAALLARLDAQSLGFVDSDAAVPGRFGAIRAAHGYAYAWAGGKTLQTYDLSAMSQPRLVSSWNLSETEAISPEIVESGARLWLKHGNRFWLFDLTDRAAPALLGEFRTRYYMSAIAGERIVCWDAERALRVFEPRAGELVEIGVCDFGGTADQRFYVNNLQAAPGFASASFYDYSSRNYALQMVDLSDPANPKLGERTRGDYYSNLNAQGDVAYALSGENLQMWDVSNPNSLKKLGKIKLAGARAIAHKAGRIAAFCMEWNSGNGYSTQLKIVDVSRPSAPRLIGQHDLPASPAFSYSSSLAMGGNALYLSASDGLHIFDISEPSRAQEIGKSPAPQTFAYLKRRGRRLLRLLSQTNDDAFTALASAFFEEISGRANLDFDHNWIAADLVAAHHPNWVQASHGRGAYLTRRDANSLVIKRRVERAPEAWNAHSERLSDVANSSVTAPVVHLARQANGANRALLPAQIESYVSSSWPNLRVLGARAAFAASVETLSPRAIAGALCVLNASKRRELLERAPASPAVASELANFLGQSLPVERDKFGRRTLSQALTRRGREIALLLVARFDLSQPEFRADGALPVLRALLNSSEAPLKSLGAQFCRRLSAPQILPLLPFAVANAAVLDALMESASRADFDKAQIDKAIRLDKREERAAAWQLVAASQTSGATLGAVWMSLLRGLSQNYDWNARTRNWQISDALNSAAGNADARACLVRGALDWREVRPHWSSDFAGSEPDSYYANAGVPGEIFAVYALFLPGETVAKTIAELTDAKWEQWKTAFVAAIAPHADVAAKFWRAVQEFLNGKDPKIEQLRARTFNDPDVAATFAGAAGQLAPDLLLSLIASVPDAVWQAWRPALLQVLQRDAPRREAFWQAARSLSFESGLLRARLIDDVEFAATFGLLESDVLQFDDPSLETLLLQWLNARELDVETTIEAAIHSLPAVRAFGLGVLSERGLNVPIALRLLESDLRDAMDAAKNWFDSREENIANLALALCDSPRLPVREYGREFVGARLDALLGDGLLPKLEENPNAEMQSFVADLLLNRAAGNDAIAEPLEFDRAVLRGRNRARRAKNLVQARRTNNAPLPDDATLLELARGKTPRDADWALQQLARRALESEVAGVEVSGVATI